jgi:hypothetical protein
VNGSNCKLSTNIPVREEREIGRVTERDDASETSVGDSSALHTTDEVNELSDNRHGYSLRP